ncbi:MAG TPA: hypothetical protein VN883_09100 [Myxococcales bacterium]|nr:hypothetical protein [Myxococcales bacterium]
MPPPAAVSPTALQRTAASCSARLLVLAVACALGGCSVRQVKRGAPLDEHAAWVMLPVRNFAETPLAGERTRALVATLLRMRGVGDLREYPDADGNDQLPDLDDQHRYQSALDWARAQGVVYGVTGAVHEWHYRGGPDGEPAVGLGLGVIELSTGRVVWSAAGALEGWGHETLSGTAQKLIGELVSDLDLR